MKTATNNKGIGIIIIKQYQPANHYNKWLYKKTHWKQHQYLINIWIQIWNLKNPNYKRYLCKLIEGRKVRQFIIQPFDYQPDNKAAHQREYTKNSLHQSLKLKLRYHVHYPKEKIKWRSMSNIHIKLSIILI